MNIQPVRILIASILASVIIFFWGFVFWTAIGNPSFVHQSVPKEHAQELVEGMAKLERGTYVHPPMDLYEGETQEDFVKRHETEAVFVLNVLPKGGEVMPPIIFVQALVHGFAAAVMVGVLLSMCANSFCCYSHRVFFVVLLGVFATVWVTRERRFGGCGHAV